MSAWPEEMPTHIDTLSPPRDHWPVCWPRGRPARVRINFFYPGPASGLKRSERNFTTGSVARWQWHLVARWHFPKQTPFVYREETQKTQNHRGRERSKQSLTVSLLVGRGGAPGRPRRAGQASRPCCVHRRAWGVWGLPVRHTAQHAPTPRWLHGSSRRRRQHRHRARGCTRTPGHVGPVQSPPVVHRTSAWLTCGAIKAAVRVRRSETRFVLVDGNWLCCVHRCAVKLCG